MQILFNKISESKGCCGVVLSQYPNYLENLNNKKPSMDHILFYGSSSATMWSKEDILLYCTAKSYGFHNVIITHPRHTNSIKKRLFEEISGYTDDIDRFTSMFLGCYFTEILGDNVIAYLKKKALLSAYEMLFKASAVCVSSQLLDIISALLNESNTLDEYYGKMRVAFLRKTSELDNYNANFKFVYLDEILLPANSSLATIEDNLIPIFGKIHSSEKREHVLGMRPSEALRSGYSLGGLQLYHAFSEVMSKANQMNLLMRNYNYGRTAKIFSIFNGIERNVILAPSFDMEFKKIDYDSSLPSHFFINCIENWPDNYLKLIEFLTHEVKTVLYQKRHGIRCDILEC